jgi:hypothetical protein
MMKLIWRALISLICGGGFYCVLIFSVFRFQPPRWIAQLLLWNIMLFQSFGRGEPIGYMPDGAPVYDGTVGFAGLPYESIFTGFVIYPILVFVLISILGAKRRELDR